MGNVVFRMRNENPYQAIRENAGLVILYALPFAEIIIREEDFLVNYIVDRHAKEIKQVNGMPVIEARELECVVKESKKRATIIIAIGVVTCGTSTLQAITSNIYEDIVKLDIDADVFDYFANTYFFADRSFVYKKERYDLYEHPYNCGYTNMRMTERAVELALAKAWIERCDGKVTEVGAVTPYYFFSDKIVDIIDPMDENHKVTKHESLMECDLVNQNVLSISTIEHIGMGDYGFQEQHTAIEGLMKILNESRRCLITVPFGFNKILDEWIAEHLNDEKVTVLSRGMNNKWKKATTKDMLYQINCMVNSVVIIEKTVLENRKEVTV